MLGVKVMTSLVYVNFNCIAGYLNEKNCNLNIMFLFCLFGCFVSQSSLITAHVFFFKYILLLDIFLNRNNVLTVLFEHALFNCKELFFVEKPSFAAGVTFFFLMMLHYFTVSYVINPFKKKRFWHF